MSNDEHIIRDLDSEIKKVQIVHKYENNIGGKRRITPEIIPIVKKKIKEMKPLTWLLIIALNIFFENIFILLISVAILSANIVLDAYIEYKDMVDEREREKIIIRDPEEFYYEEFKYATALYNYVSEDERKYNEAVERQNRNKPKKEIEITYTKEDEINLMVEAIEDYFYCYKLPPLVVKSYEWDVFFDTLYSEFKMRGIKKEYFHAVSEVIRYTLANILIDGAKSVRIEDFIYNLHYLCKTRANRGILPNHFLIQDIERIQSKMKLKIRNNKSKDNKKYAKQL